MALIYKFTPKQAKEIEAAYKVAANKWAADHLYMLLLRANGKELKDIAKEMDVDPSTVSRLVNKYHRLGLVKLVEELASQFPRPKNVKFNAKQIAELEQALANASTARERCRVQAVLLRAKGRSVKETVELTGYAPTHVEHLIRNYRDNGLQSILIKKKIRRSPAKAVCPFTEEQKAEIETALKTVTNERALVRLKALYLRCCGEKISDISEKLGICLTVIVQTTSIYKKKGLNGIIDHETKGKCHFTEEEKAEIEAACKTATDKRDLVRLNALYLRCCGEKIKDIAKKVGVTSQTVSRAIAVYKKEGLEGVLKQQHKRE